MRQTFSKVQIQVGVDQEVDLQQQHTVDHGFSSFFSKNSKEEIHKSQIIGVIKIQLGSVS